MKSLTPEQLDRIEAKYLRMRNSKCPCCQDVATRGSECGDCGRTQKPMDPRPLIAEIRRLRADLKAATPPRQGAQSTMPPARTQSEVDTPW